MLQSQIEKKDLFVDVESLVSSINLHAVEVSRSEGRETTKINVVLYKKECDITLDELEAAYNILYPRFSVLLGERELSLEVSSPGLGRNFKDTYEFVVFTGKRVRLYSTEESQYITGIIQSADKREVVLTSYLKEDTKETGDEIKINFNSIAKAKLDYSWEDKND